MIHFEKVIPASFPLLNHEHRVVVDWYLDGFLLHEGAVLLVVWPLINKTTLWLNTVITKTSFWAQISAIESLLYFILKRDFILYQSEHESKERFQTFVHNQVFTDAEELCPPHQSSTFGNSFDPSYNFCPSFSEAWS